MIINRLKSCCDGCKSRSTNLDEVKMYSGEDIVEVVTTINCEHDEVCGKYLAEED